MFEKEITFDRFIRGLIIVLGIIAVIWLLNRLSSVLLPFFIAWFLAYMHYPLVHFLQFRLKLRNRVISIIVAVLLVLAILTGLIALILPPTIEEFSQLRDAVSLYMNDTLAGTDIPKQLEAFLSQYIDGNSLLKLVQQSSFMEAVQGVMAQLWNLLSGTINFGRLYYCFRH